MKIVIDLEDDIVNGVDGFGSVEALEGLTQMTLTEAKQRMTAKAAELAALARAGHINYVGAENTIAAYAEGLTPDCADYSEAWNLYDHGIQQFRAFHRSESAMGRVAQARPGSAPGRERAKMRAHTIRSLSIADSEPHTDDCSIERKP